MAPEFRSAARLVVVDPYNRVLLLQHVRPSGQRLWATPGGGLEDGETFEEAAAREAHEELGVRNPYLSTLCDRTADFVSVDRQVHQTGGFSSFVWTLLNWTIKFERRIAARGFLKHAGGRWPTFKIPVN